MNEPNVVDFFDSLITEGLSHCGINLEKISSDTVFVAAVSGGADSISMLVSLSHVLKNRAVLEVCTVNHNLREEKETEGDAEYVQDFCRQHNIFCKRFDIPRGKINELALQRKSGIEEAARFLRYGALEQFAGERKASYICLAHNKNDQLETVLMRFLQGSDSKGLSGIPQKRQEFIRPLLNISRSQIENYLVSQNISWRTDKTNFETSMLRNKIRNRIIPLLDEEIEGWQKAVLTLARKSAEDEKFIADETEKIKAQIAFEAQTVAGNSRISFDRQKFSQLPQSVQRRIFYDAVELLGAEKRIPYSFIEETCQLISENKFVNEKSAGGISVQLSEKSIIVQKKIIYTTESSFFAIIDKTGEYEIDCWKIKVNESELPEGITLIAENDRRLCTLNLPHLKFPFAFRNRQLLDSIEASTGEMKSVQKILEEYKTDSSSAEQKKYIRNSIPLIQELFTPEQKIICIWGELLGFYNWIVK